MTIEYAISKSFYVKRRGWLKFKKVLKSSVKGWVRLDGAHLNVVDYRANDWSYKRSCPWQKYQKS